MTSVLQCLMSYEEYFLGFHESCFNNDTVPNITFTCEHGIPPTCWHYSSLPLSLLFSSSDTLTLVHFSAHCLYKHMPLYLGYLPLKMSNASNILLCIGSKLISQCLVWLAWTSLFEQRCHSLIYDQSQSLGEEKAHNNGHICTVLPHTSFSVCEN